MVIIAQELNADPFLKTMILKHRLFHKQPKPLFKNRSHYLDFVTDIPKDSVDRATLFFKTNIIDNYQEFSLDGSYGLYRFKYNPKIYPGASIQYYFVIESNDNIYGTPLNSQGMLVPINGEFIDPIQYYKQRARMNQ